jgi:hypothetical protein
MKNLKAKPDGEETELRVDWRTPRPLWLNLHAEFRFTRDVAAAADNALLPLYFDGSPGRDGLVEAWDDEPGVLSRAWDNPPYNPKGAIETWLQKALKEAARGVFSVRLKVVPAGSTGLRVFIRPVDMDGLSFWTFVDLHSKEVLEEGLRAAAERIVRELLSKALRRTPPPLVATFTGVTEVVVLPAAPIPQRPATLKKRFGERLS